jgi:hypothetical protein
MGNITTGVVRVGDKAELGTNFNSTIKRSFGGGWAEILCELLQNSQRAGATAVSITVDLENKKVILHDNGSGIAAGINEWDKAMDEWRKLFCYTSTGYEDAKVEQQKAMGVGLLALVACDQVREVFVYSHGRKVTINTDRFWNEPGYWESWTELVSPNVQQTDGFLIGFEVKDVKSLFEDRYTTEKTLLQVLTNHSLDNPIIGFPQYLSITLNGEPLNLPTPYELMVAGSENCWLKTEYQGNEVYFRAGTGSSVINWYGQIIQIDYKLNPDVLFLINVNEGTPFTPKAPTRQGVIPDAKLAGFKEFLYESAFGKLEEMEAGLDAAYEDYCRSGDNASGNKFRPAYLTPEFLRMLWNKDKNRTQKLSWVEAGTVKDEWADSSDILVWSSTAVFYYREIPVFIAENMYTFSEFQIYDPVVKKWVDKPEWQEMEYGTGSFMVEVLPEARVFLAGSDKIKVNNIYWKPGQHLTQCFYQRGVFGLAPENLSTEEAIAILDSTNGWRKLEHTVFSFTYGSTDVTEVTDLIVGAETYKDQHDIIFSDTGLSATFESGERDYEDAHYDFGESLSRLARMIDTMKIQHYFDYSELLTLCCERLGDQAVKIQSIVFQYAAQPEAANGDDAATPPASPVESAPAAEAETKAGDKLIVTTTDNRVVEFNIAK